MKRILTGLLICALLLAGCGASAPETTAQTEAPTETVTEALETTAATEPEETVSETTEATEPVQEEPAQRITEGLTMMHGKVDRTGILSDDSPYTKIKVQGGSELRLLVDSEEPFSGLYLYWDTLPGTYTLTWEGGSLECGQEDFYHDYIRLPEAVSGVEIVLEAEKSAWLCDMALFTEGRAPEGIQDWLPPCENADILAFPTHSDDDVLFFGPLLSYYAMDRGLTVQTAFMVNHREMPQRAHERLNGLWEMGIRHYPILGDAPDAGTHSFDEAMGIYASSDILGWQVEQIRRFRPLVIVGHDLKGEYGNGGHKVNAHFLTQAVEAAADPASCPESFEAYGVWDAPKLYLHLYEEDQIVLDVNTPIPSDGAGRTPFEVAKDAFKHHISQNRTGMAVLQGSEYPRYDCTLFGLYRTQVGTDSLADIMDHIDPAHWRQED